LLALDFEPENPENEPLNRQLVEMAASLALSEFAQLHVVHAWKLEHESFFRSARSGLSREEVDQMIVDEEDARRRWLEKFVADCCRSLGTEASGYLKPEFHLIRGYAEEVVPRCASDLGAELVVMGTVGRTGIPGFVIGNTADAILNRIDCSVLAVKPAGFVSPVAVDNSG
jgi:nucleotide-binding universal stress UspA family protein